MLAVGVQILLGQSGLLKEYATVYGHFGGYISFRYAMYGVLIGNALLLSYRHSVPKFDKQYLDQAMLERPALNLIVGSVLSYVLARLVAEGKLEVNLLGLELKRSSSGGFHDSGALFMIGLAACTSADIFLQRLIETTRKSAG